MFLHIVHIFCKLSARRSGPAAVAVDGRRDGSRRLPCWLPVAAMCGQRLLPPPLTATAAAPCSCHRLPELLRASSSCPPPQSQLVVCCSCLQSRLLPAKEALLTLTSPVTAHLVARPPAAAASQLAASANLTRVTRAERMSGDLCGGEADI